MKKKIIIGVLVLVLLLGTVTYLITKPINNQYIEYTSAHEYKTELIKAIESEDYTLASNLVYSIANSEYYEELDKEVVDIKYNNVEASSTSETLYNGLIGSLEYIDITEDSSFEINQIDMNNLNDNGAVYYEYTLDGIAGYYVNYYNDDRLRVYDSIEECMEWKDEEYCSNYLYLDISGEFPSPNTIGIANINYTIFNSDYKNSEQETTIDYGSNKEFDTLIDIVYDLDTIMDEGTSQEEKDELQLKLIDIAHENGKFGYGLKVNGDYDYDSTPDGSIYIDNVHDTYTNANENGEIESFVNGGYVSEEGVIDMSQIADDYLDYYDMFDAIDDSITNYVIL